VDDLHADLKSIWCWFCYERLDGVSLCGDDNLKGSVCWTGNLNHVKAHCVLLKMSYFSSETDFDSNIGSPRRENDMFVGAG
jgi:hypothetical protein